MRLRFFESSSGQRHIEPRDHYLYRAPEPEIQLNVIGTGTIGQEHMRVASMLGRAQVRGIFDRSPHSARVASEEFVRHSSEKPVIFDDLDAAIDDPDADAFIICTPNFSHLAVLQAVMRSGKPILLEKPMATTLEDAATIVKLARAHPAPIRLGLQYRFKSIYVEAAHELSQRRSIGNLKTLRIAEYRPPFLDKVDQWNKFAEYSGGTLIEKCCHYFDLMNRFSGSRPKRVFAVGGQDVNFLDFEKDGRKSDILDNAVVIVEYDNGVRANFELNMFSPNFHEELAACGDLGRFTASEVFDVMQTEQSSSRVKVELSEGGAARDASVAYPKRIEESGHHGATYYEHAAFLDAIAGLPNMAATPEEGFWSIVVGAAADRSLAIGQPVDVTELLKDTDPSVYT